MVDRNRFTVVTGGLSDDENSPKVEEQATPTLFDDVDEAEEQEAQTEVVADASDIEVKDEKPAFDRSSLSDIDYRWSWVEINLKNIVHNVQVFKRKLSPRVKVMAIVKADGYGHGAVQVAKAALLGGATWFGVATVEEALELRDADITEPILILSQPPENAIPLLLEYDIIPSVYEPDFAIALGEAAAARDVVATYHLAINTGMNRIGVAYTDVVPFLQSFAFHSNLQLGGTFTHFATADSLDEYTFRLQLRRFNEALAAMEQAHINPGIRHCAASAAAIRFKEAHFDMVRYGIAMYGLHPSPITRNLIELWPAMYVKAKVTAVNDVALGEGVGYGMTYQSPGNVYIATLPVGYADGLSRQLSNGMSVLHRGEFRRQAGNICMDQFMFEVDRRSAKASRPEIGDEVIIIGRDGDKVLLLDDMADALKTINYELACRFGMRMRRIYTGL